MKHEEMEELLKKIQGDVKLMSNEEIEKKYSEFCKINYEAFLCQTKKFCHENSLDFEKYILQHNCSVRNIMRTLEDTYFPPKSHPTGLRKKQTSDESIYNDR
jgi:hypothetical protein